MKLLLWIGNEPNQLALANKVSKEFTIVGIVTESRKQKRKVTLRKIFDSLYEKIFLSDINQAWIGMKNHYKNRNNDLNVSRLDVENINTEEVYQFSKELNPDLILVSGTRLIKERLLSLRPKKGILNLHTGLSPFIKGGPNCTNWCIATNQFHLVGNTIMFIDEGIDSGNIVNSELTTIDWNSSLLAIHIAVMEHAHELYINAVRAVLNDSVTGVKQTEIGLGKTYYTKDWGLKQKKELIKQLKRIKTYK